MNKIDIQAPHLIQSLIILVILNLHIPVFGQSKQLETDKGIAASIAPYDSDIRTDILKASENPQALAELQKSQDQTVAAFQKIIHGFRQKKQAWFYTLTRYPDFMHKLATLPDKQSKAEILKLLPNQSADLQEAAWEIYSSEKKDLVKLDNIQASAQQNFDTIIQNLDESAKAAFKKLSTLPDVLTLLTNNIELTSRLGEHYKSDPAALVNRLESLHDSLEVEDEYEAQAFKKQLADDPKATEELSQASRDYAAENGFNPPTQQNDDMINNSSYFNDPYSYWFGYPSWYGSPLWYPDSFWYESGFFMGVGGFGFYGFPSYGFSTWFFQGSRYNRYPNLYHQFGNYYQHNMAQGRIMGAGNHGFMSVANGHFNPKGGNQMNRLTSPESYKRSEGQSIQSKGNAGRSNGNAPRSNGNIPHSNANSYHTQSWGSYGGRGNSVGGGGSRGGVGGGGGGSHGAGGGGHR